MDARDIHWTHGRTVRLSIADEVPDPEGVLSRASYALLFVRGDRPLGRTLQIELGSLGVDVEVQTADPLAQEILVHVSPCRWGTGHQPRPLGHHRWD